MKGALPRVIADTDDLEAQVLRLAAGRGSLLIHQSQAHSVGGSFDIPHAETCTILLLHQSGYSEENELGALKTIADALSAMEAAVGLRALEQAVRTSTVPKNIGMPEDRL